MNKLAADPRPAITDRTHLSRFTPSLMPLETLEAIFVQREDLAVDTVDRIRESAVTENKHHLLFVGPRGCGKTHFTSLVTGRVNRIDDLDDQLRVAWLNEDETSTSFVDFQLRVYRALCKEYPEEFPEEELSPLFDLSPEDAAEKLSGMIVKKLECRTALIVVENLDSVFDGLAKEGQHEWRAFLQEHPHFAILATAQQLSEAISDRESPFFGFFQIDHFLPLSIDEATRLLTRIAELQLDTDLASFLRTPTGRSRVRALYHLSGGNHRVFIILSEFIDRETLDELIGPFEKMLDELTPYYQERLRWLSPLQRKIVEHLCGCLRPVPVKEIARVLFTSNQSIATQLKDLREKGYVQSNTRGRESLYELKEPLMRMAMELKENRGEPIRLIVDFLRIWYDQDQLEYWLLSLSSNRTREFNHLSAAVAEMGEETSDPVLQAILEDIEQYEQANDQQALIKASEELADRRSRVEDWIKLSYLYFGNERLSEALASMDRISDDMVSEANTENKTVGHIWKYRGYLALQLGDYVRSLDSFDRAIEVDSEDPVAWSGRSGSLVLLERQEEALEAIDNAIALAPTEASYLKDRAVTLLTLDRHDDALIAFERSMEADNGDVETRMLHGLAHLKVGHHEAAIKSLGDAIRLDPTHGDARLWHVLAIIHSGQWEYGIESLKLALLECVELSSESNFIFSAFPGVIFENTQAPVAWYKRAAQLLDCFSEANRLAEIGEGLVQSLDSIPSWMHTAKSLESWLDVWKEAGRVYGKLSVALRMFETGIHYLQTGDRATLLDLNIEERAILEQVFGLEEAPS
ncbi:MAG: tetratricopeptide repeat protein [Planctomycetaceae bacterium]|nr:tetratricopeptide repeat protein [Planctomycetaceae bacterium]